MKKTTEVQEVALQIPTEEKAKKAPYESPQLIVHGKVDKMTLQTGAP